MANQMQREQVFKMLRGIACSGIVKRRIRISWIHFVAVGLILGPYIYTMAQPEKSLKFRFIPSTNENGDLIKPHSSYNRLATEVKIFIIFSFSYT